ncbi:MAG: hypothetical protein M3305_04385 [Actinomycetota bacterium]|jgi:NADPH:quinone reductase-like Zn-dependent oxidoreductase|nr:hypothetical protein [Actinomycetota bacterium]
MRKNWTAARFFPRLRLGPSLEEIFGWLSSGELRRIIGASYPLEHAYKA